MSELPISDIRGSYSDSHYSHDCCDSSTRSLIEPYIESSSSISELEDKIEILQRAMHADPSMVQQLTQGREMIQNGNGLESIKNSLRQI